MSVKVDERLLEDIERQHEDLFAQFKNLEILATSGEEQERSLAALETLLKSVADHFECEQRLMVNVRYPHASGHQWQHETLLDDMRGLVAAARLVPHVSPEALQAIREVIHNHTEEADADLFNYMRSL